MSKFRFHFRKVTLTAFMMLVCLVFCVSAQTTLITDEVTDDYAILNGIRYERVRTIQQLESIPGIKIVNKNKVLKTSQLEQEINWNEISFSLTVIAGNRKGGNCNVCPRGKKSCACVKLIEDDGELKVVDNKSYDDDMNEIYQGSNFTRLYFNSSYDAIVIK